MSIYSKRGIAVFVMGLLFAGCERSSSPSSSPSSELAKDEQPAGEISLKTISFAELDNQVRALTGNIVVVDFWADFCPPCKAAFPHLIELHKRFADQGVVCVSVTVDDPKDKEAALKFLQQQGAGFRNFHLDDEKWGDKVDLSGPPATFVFDRTNRLAGRFDTNNPDKPYRFENVEKTVQSLLSAKTEN